MTLPTLLAQRIAQDRFDLQAHEARHLGIDSATIHRWQKAGHLEAFGNGSYLIVAPVAGEDPFAQERQLHLRRCQAITAGIPGAYLVGRSAALLWNLPVFSFPGVVEISRETRFQTKRRSVVFRPPWPADTRKRYGMRAQTAEHAAVQIAADHGVVAGLVTADAALHVGGSAYSLTAGGKAFGLGRGVRNVRRVVELADGRVESPGETQLRLVCLDGGIPLIPQATILDDNGRFLGRVDFQVEGTNVLLEFDGMTKYTAPEVLRREKARELRLQRAGYVVLRFTQQDLALPRDVVRAIRSAMGAAA